MRNRTVLLARVRVQQPTTTRRWKLFVAAVKILGGRISPVYRRRLWRPKRPNKWPWTRGPYLIHAQQTAFNSNRIRPAGLRATTPTSNRPYRPMSSIVYYYIVMIRDIISYKYILYHNNLLYIIYYFDRFSAIFFALIRHSKFIVSYDNS